MMQREDIDLDALPAPRASDRRKSTMREPMIARAVRFAQHLVTFALTLLAASFVTFLVLTALPGSAAQQLIGAEATPQQIAALETKLHLDAPRSELYLRWLRAAAAGDFGTSIGSGQPVAKLLRERLPVSLELALYAFVLALSLAIPVALLCARYSGSWIDRVLAALSTIGLSIPSYVFAIVLVLVFAVTLRIFPSIGFVPLEEGLLPNLETLTLPAIAIAFPLFCFYTRFLRGDLIEQMASEDYVTTAIAKGLGPWQVLSRHVLRNSLSGLLTIIGLHLGTLIGGTVIIEQIFGLPGIGQLLLHAVVTRDAPIVQAVVLLLVFFVVTANLLIDLSYSLLDPRVSYARR